MDAVTVTIRDIAREVNFNYSTVARALKKDPRVAEKTRRLITKKAKEMGYQPNYVASALVKGGLNVIGLIVGDVSTLPYPFVVQSIERVARSHGLSLIVCSANAKREQEEHYLSIMQHYRPVGIIDMSQYSVGYDEYISNIQRSGCNIVMINRRCFDPEISEINFDYAVGSAAAIEHLVSEGHRRIVFLGFKGGRENVQARIEACRYAARKYGFELEEILGTEEDRNFLPEDYTMELDIECMTKIMRKRLQTGVSLPTAIFASNDFCAVGAIRACSEFGFRVPEDISVVGFDDSLGNLLPLPLTTVTMPVQEAAKIAAEHLLERAQGLCGPIKEEIPCEFIIRKSCLCASGK